MPKGDFNILLLYCFPTLLKSHFGIGVLLKISCIFSEQLFYKNTYGTLLLNDYK